MDIAREFLFVIGAYKPGFENGIITGAFIVILILTIVFIISNIIKNSTRASELREEKTQDNSEDVIENYKKEIESLKSDINNKSQKSYKEGILYSLNLLQREGRLIDFFKEDISSFKDEQVGAAARQIHTGCNKLLDEYFEIKPVMETEEGKKITLDKNYDPAKIRMTGKIPENFPAEGILRHRGWIANKVDVPKKTGKVNPNIITPAEIEY